MAKHDVSFSIPERELGKADVQFGDMNDAMMRTRAFENSVWVAFVHPKRCLIIDPSGNVVARDRGSDRELMK